MLVLAPAACCLAGIAAHEALLTLTRSIRGRLAVKAQAGGLMEGAVNLDGSADKAPEAGATKAEPSKRASRKAGEVTKVPSPALVHICVCIEVNSSMPPVVR